MARVVLWGFGARDGVTVSILAALGHREHCVQHRAILRDSSFLDLATYCHNFLIIFRRHAMAAPPRHESLDIAGSHLINGWITELALGAESNGLHSSCVAA